MNDWPYHQYIFLDLAPGFRQLKPDLRADLIQELSHWLGSKKTVEHVAYATLGFTPGTTFALWLRSHHPEDLQNAVRDLLNLKIGEWLTLRHSLFGLTRKSQYSNRPQKSDQVIPAGEHLPYLVIYPFTKTAEWHLLPFEQRKQLMKAHIMVGITHPSIRQCLLYAYGVDDHEFIVSYETPTLDAFQDLVMELRGTEARRYTQNDLPIYTCVYKTTEELVAWL